MTQTVLESGPQAANSRSDRGLGPRDQRPTGAGRAAELYCVVKVGDSLYAKSALGEYLFWNGDLASLPAAASKTLMSIEEIVVVDELSGMAGEFAVYVAYTTDAGVLVYNSTPMQVIVEP